MKLLVFLADGFEEVEALTVVDYLRRVGVAVEMVSITDEKEVKGAHDIRVLADTSISSLGDLSSYSGLVVPGGMPGSTNLRDSARVVEIVREMNESDKLVAAICAGPIVLAEAGVIEGKKITSYPGFEEVLARGNYKEEGAVRDGNLITARGPALAVDFALEIVEYLLGAEKAGELKKDILYK